VTYRSGIVLWVGSMLGFLGLLVGLGALAAGGLAVGVPMTLVGLLGATMAFRTRVVLRVASLEAHNFVKSHYVEYGDIASIHVGRSVFIERTDGTGFRALGCMKPNDIPDGSRKFERMVADLNRRRMGVVGERDES